METIRKYVKSALAVAVVVGAFVTEVIRALTLLAG